MLAHENIEMKNSGHLKYDKNDRDGVGEGRPNVAMGEQHAWWRLGKW